MINQPPLIIRDGMRPLNQAIQSAIRCSSFEYNIIQLSKCGCDKRGATRELCDETIVAIALAKEMASECAIKSAIDPIVSDGFVPPS